jgi:fructose-1,6-bisphosphatase III
MATSLDLQEQTVLQALAGQYPTADDALAEEAGLRASLSLPKGVIHIVSDVHGEYKKLRHIINNASGSLRPYVGSLFADKLTSAEIQDLLAVLYYPNEVFEELRAQLADAQWRQHWVRVTLRRQFEIVRELARRYRRQHVVRLIPSVWLELFEELMEEPSYGRGGAYVDEMIQALAEHNRDLAAVRAASRLVRNLSISEIIVAGDLGDRGPRVDRVVDYLMEQPNVSFTWGNHDASWMGACLGQEALIATVLRISLRYRRLSQLEEGYGLIISPLEKLARTVYSDDPATRFKTKGTGLRDDLLMARMQKAAAIMQFKLEGQTSRRHPNWDMEHRNLLHRMDLTAGTVEIDGQKHPLLDTFLPTFDPEDPYELSAEERACMDRLRQSFVTSSRLWDHMSFVARRGVPLLIRDEAVIFHGCVPVDADGTFLSLNIEGKELSGRPLFEGINSVVRRAYRQGASAATRDVDWFWYLWTGPRSPMFGKDKMATFEGYFVSDPATHHETRNPYFKLIHERAFCDKVAAEMGVTHNPLIVNGHVPVKVEKGEEPVKRSGIAVTIDGAFSEAYGDRGYTLVLAPEGIALAEHHHFESINEAITAGADIIPKVTIVRKYDRPRTIGDTAEGESIRRRAAALDRLVNAYRDGDLVENDLG